MEKNKIPVIAGLAATGAEVRRRPRITEALRHLATLDLAGDDDQVHELLGILCAIAPAAVIEAVHDVQAPRRG
jgi:hypothetical protein